MPPPFDIGIGAVLSFKPRGKGKTDCLVVREIEWGEEELGNSPYDVEFYAIVQALRHWRHYLIMRDFLGFSGHEALQFWNAQKSES